MATNSRKRPIDSAVLWRCIGLLTNLLVLTCASYPTVEAPLPPKSLAAMGTVFVAHIEETSNPGVHAAPYKPMAERILEQAGFRVVKEDRAEFHLIIRTRTEALKIRYITRDRETFYSYKGVRSAGTLEVITTAREPMFLHFSSEKDPPIFAKKWDDEEPDPALAPYGEAFELPGGFYDAMNALLLEQISQDRFLRMVNLPFKDFNGLDYKGSLIRSLHERGITAASPQLMRLLSDNEFSCGTICPILVEWKYEPVLDYAIAILGSEKKPYDLEPVFETHVQFKQRRSIPSLIAFLRTVRNTKSDRDSKHQKLALRALREISGQDLGEEPSAWAEWFKAQH